MLMAYGPWVDSGEGNKGSVCTPCLQCSGVTDSWWIS
jgi:hypothetical protein